MITSTEEYLEMLANIEANKEILPILVQKSEPFFEIDLNTREIIIPSDFKDFLAVKTDHKAETVYFLCDRYFDDKDLSEYTAVVQYMNKYGEYGVSLMSQKDTETFKDEGKFVLGWEIDNTVTSRQGYIEYSVRFYRIDNDTDTFEFSLNTNVQKSLIIDTLDIMDKVGASTDNSTNLLTQLLDIVSKGGIGNGSTKDVIKKTEGEPEIKSNFWLNNNKELFFGDGNEFVQIYYKEPKIDENKLDNDLDVELNKVLSMN